MFKKIIVTSLLLVSSIGHLWSESRSPEQVLAYALFCQHIANASSALMTDDELSALAYTIKKESLKENCAEREVRRFFIAYTKEKAQYYGRLVKQSKAVWAKRFSVGWKAVVAGLGTLIVYIAWKDYFNASENIKQSTDKLHALGASRVFVSYDSVYAWYSSDADKTAIMQELWRCGQYHEDTNVGRALMTSFGGVSMFVLALFECVEDIKGAFHAQSYYDRCSRVIKELKKV